MHDQEKIPPVKFSCLKDFELSIDFRMDFVFALVYWLSLLFHNDYYFYLLAGLSAWYLLREGADKRVMVASVVLTFLLVFSRKAHKPADRKPVNRPDDAFPFFPDDPRRKT